MGLSQKHDHRNIYIVIVVHRDQTSKKQKKPKPSRLCFAFEKPFPKAFDLKNFKVFFALLEDPDPLSGQTFSVVWLI